MYSTMGRQQSELSTESPKPEIVFLFFRIVERHTTIVARSQVLIQPWHHKIDLVDVNMNYKSVKNNIRKGTRKHMFVQYNFGF